jgi:hypothetical protein
LSTAQTNNQQTETRKKKKGGVKLSTKKARGRISPCIRKSYVLSSYKDKGICTSGQRDSQKLPLSTNQGNSLDWLERLK